VGVCLLALVWALSAGTGRTAAPVEAQHGVAPLNPCDTFRLALAANTNGASGALTPNISIFYTGPAACRLRATLTFTIRDSSGKLLPIRGNPARLTLKANRIGRTGKPASVSWLWSSWCDRAKRPFIYEGRIGQLAVRFFERSTPRCDNGASSISVLLACPQPENASLVAPKLRETARLACRD
jgi:hypothetical protein